VREPRGEGSGSLELAAVPEPKAYGLAMAVAVLTFARCGVALVKGSCCRQSISKCLMWVWRPYTQGGFDHDAFDLQFKFVIQEIMPFLSHAMIPLGNLTNDHQRRAPCPPWPGHPEWWRQESRN
jgi:hypothetical protein